MPKDWRKDQNRDPYFRQAHAEGYRARSAYKLLEIQTRFRVLKPGTRVLDLGAAPGSWSQVAAKIVGAGGRVVAIDLTPIDPLPGVETVQGDARAPEIADRLRDLLGGEADVVLSDMAPSTTGVAATDHARSIELAETALDLAARLSRPGSALIVKVFEGPDLQEFLAAARRLYRSCRLVRPEASRRESKETFVVCLERTHLPYAQL